MRISKPSSIYKTKACEVEAIILTTPLRGEYIQSPKNNKKTLENILKKTIYCLFKSNASKSNNLFMYLK